jgi:hypothetical protein
MANDDNADLSKRVYLECECTDFDHTVRVSLWDWNNYTDPENILISHYSSPSASFMHLILQPYSVCPDFTFLI